MYKIAYRNAAVGPYPEREERQEDKTERLAAWIGGKLAPWLRPRAGNFSDIVDAVNRHSQFVAGLDENEIRALSGELGKGLCKNGFTEELVARTFALVREVSGRTTGLRHLDVQLIGGAVMLNGMVAEMETGEGKTLTATLTASALALGGIPVHVITVNDYLARRDAEWMGQIYRAMGLSVGTIIHGMDSAARRQAYLSDITYCTNKEVAFDYLRDRITLWDRPSPLRLQLERLYGETSRMRGLVMRGLHFAIVDEADSVLVDEARTPLIISSEAADLFHPDVYKLALRIAGELLDGVDYRISDNDRFVDLLGPSKVKLDSEEWSAAGIPLNAPQREELVRQALVALHLFDRDKHYLVKDGKVQIVDEYTGRLMADRSWERGLHQLIEIKEGCESTTIKETKARISYQRFFRRYLMLAGMTGTAREIAGELWSIYRLRVVTIPTNRPLRRLLLPDRVYPDAESKWAALMKIATVIHKTGRPILVGSRSVEASEHISELMRDAGLEHKVLNARQDLEEAQIIARAGELGAITVATNMAGRGTDIVLAPGVAELGGLHVIATERHESRRIDRQLFGRCGRQGDPGSCEAVISLEDELLVVYCNAVLRELAQAGAGLPISSVSRLLTGAVFCWSQHSAESQHARIRRDLLRFDEQISDSLAFTGRLE
jgi:preprotein translocase subunit SecA